MDEPRTDEWVAHGCGCGFGIGDVEESFPTRVEAIERMKYWDTKTDISPLQLVSPSGVVERWITVRHGGWARG